MNCEKSKNVLSNFLLFRVLQHFDTNLARGFLLEAYFYHCTISWNVDFNFYLRLVANEPSTAARQSPERAVAPWRRKGAPSVKFLKNI